MKHIFGRVTPATVLSALALFVALGGTGWADQVLGTGSVGTAQLARNAVTTPKILNGAVTKPKLGPAAVTTSALAKAAITSSALAKGAVTSSALAKGAVTSSALAKGAVTGAAIAVGTITADRLATGVVGGIAGTKISTVVSPLTTVPAGSVGTAVTATCAAGQKAIGGAWNAGRFAFTDSEGPTPDGTGWSAVFETGSASSAAVTVSAMCAAP
jgi:hypothetical protein